MNLNAVTDPQLQRLRTEWLYQQSKVSQTAGLINAGIYIFISKDLISFSALTTWSICVLAVYLSRIFFQRWFNLKYVKERRAFDAQLWENLFAFGAFLSGSSWGVAGFFLLPRGFIAYHAFFGFLLAGTTAGATVAYCASKKSVQAFLLPSVLPLALRLALEGTSFQNAMAILLVLYIVLFSVLVMRMSSYVSDSLWLRFEKDQLILELNNTQSKVAHSAKMAALGEMAAGVSHEINNPVTIIQGKVASLRNMALDNSLNREQVCIVADKIEATASRIARIISGLRSFAREGRDDPVELISLKELILETLDYCQARFKNHGINLTMNEFPGDLTLGCRPIQISQVLLNLLNNAFDAVKGRRESWVKLEIQTTLSEYITLVVSDSGPGIPFEVREKIMQPFFTTKAVGKGSGLGLSIAKGIVEGHGGRLYLDVESPYTSFVVNLPRPKENAERSIA